MHNSVLNVLLIERSSCDARTICELLSVAKAVEFRVEWVERLSAGLEWLASGSFDVVLVDIERPEIDDFKGFQRLCSVGSDTPIIVLSDVADEKLALAAVKSGAQNHLVKGEFDADMIERSLRYAIERQRARNALAEKRAALGRSNDLRREQARILESIMRSIADGVVVDDKDGKFLVFNPAGERLVGLGATDLEPGRRSDHYHLYRPDGETPFPPENLPLVRAMRGETVVDEEVVVRHRDGNVIVECHWNAANR